MYLRLEGLIKLSLIIQIERSVTIHNDLVDWNWICLRETSLIGQGQKDFYDCYTATGTSFWL